MAFLKKYLERKAKGIYRRLTSDHITKNFKWYEFDCKDEACTQVPDDLRSNVIELCNNLEIIREHFGSSSILIVSGYRTFEYNKKIGGVSNSQHLLGNAADIRIKGYTVKQVYDGILELMNKNRIKKGGLAFSEGMNFVHYDIRGHFATWKYIK